MNFSGPYYHLAAQLGCKVARSVGQAEFAKEILGMHFGTVAKTGVLRSGVGQGWSSRCQARHGLCRLDSLVPILVPGAKRVQRHWQRGYTCDGWGKGQDVGAGLLVPGLGQARGRLGGRRV